MTPLLLALGPNFAGHRAGDDFQMIGRRQLLGRIMAVAGAGVVPVSGIAEAKATHGKFVGTVRAEWDADGRHMTLLAPFQYLDMGGSPWRVPKGATIDGASIPQVLWPVMGGPFEGKYRNASVIHDWYCDVRTRPWQRVHRMFLEGMLASGVPEYEARLLYFGVYAGGPRWDQQAVRNNRLRVGEEIKRLTGDASAPAVFHACDPGRAFCRTVFRTDEQPSSAMAVDAGDAGTVQWAWSKLRPLRDVSDRNAPVITLNLWREEVAPPITDPGNLKESAAKLARSKLDIAAAERVLDQGP